MKRKLFTLIAIFSFCFFQSCQDHEIKKAPEAAELISKIAAADDQKLLQGLGLLQEKASKNGRISQTKIASLQLDSAIKRLNPDLGSTNYSFSVEENKPYSLTNLVITENKGSYLAFFVEYISDNPKQGWNLANFSGKMKVTSVDGKREFERVVKPPQVKNGRTSSECEFNFAIVYVITPYGITQYTEWSFVCTLGGSGGFGWAVEGFGVGDGNNNGGSGNSGGEIDPGKIGIDDGDSSDPTRTINCDQLKSMHGEPANGAMDFWRSNQGLTREQIIKQRPDRSVTGIGSQEGGPGIRYVNDVLNPKNIIDLRHMLVIGYYGRAVGESVEMMQWLQDNESGFDSQDFYSNELGYQFYAEYGSAINANPTAFADYLISFLNKPSLRNAVSNPPDCK
jgi:hypothetical protein